MRPRRRGGQTRGVIEVRHLTERYGRVTAVDDIGFTVRAGTLLGVTGDVARYLPDQAGERLVTVGGPDAVAALVVVLGRTRVGDGDG